MIRLPRGRALQRNIDTTYVRLDGVLHSLGGQSFTGYVRVVGEAVEGLIFFRDGALIAGLFERDDEIRSGPEALRDVLGLAARPRAFLDISQLSHELLAAVLAVTHDPPVTVDPGTTPADLRGLLASAANDAITGAYRLQAATGTHVLFFADGELLGEFRPDVEEWSDVPEGLPRTISPWERWHRPDAATLRTIDLDARKAEAWAAVAESVERYAPGFGRHLIRLECRRFLVADPARLLKAELVHLVDQLRARARLVIGDRRAAAMHAEALAATAGVIDAGI